MYKLLILILLLNISIQNNLYGIVFYKNSFTNILYKYKEYTPLLHYWRKIYSIDFRRMSNETLSKILVKTCSQIKIPSNQIFVSNRGLYLYNTRHVFLNIPILYRYDSIIMMASIKFISGADRNFARGGIGFGYRAKRLRDKWIIGKYYIIVLGRFSHKNMPKVDFEGHFPSYSWLYALNGRRVSLNKSIILWITYSRNYVYGGTGLPSKNIDYCFKQNYWYVYDKNIPRPLYPEISSFFGAKIIIENITFYVLEKNFRKNIEYLLPRYSIIKYRYYALNYVSSIYMFFNRNLNILSYDPDFLKYRTRYGFHFIFQNMPKYRTQIWFKNITIYVNGQNSFHIPGEGIKDLIIDLYGVNNSIVFASKYSSLEEAFMNTIPGDILVLDRDGSISIYYPLKIILNDSRVKIKCFSNISLTGFSKNLSINIVEKNTSIKIFNLTTGSLKLNSLLESSILILNSNIGLGDIYVWNRESDVNILLNRFDKLFLSVNVSRLRFALNFIKNIFPRHIYAEKICLSEKIFYIYNEVIFYNRLGNYYQYINGCKIYLLDSNMDLCSEYPIKIYGSGENSIIDYFPIANTVISTESFSGRIVLIYRLDTIYILKLRVKLKKIFLLPFYLKMFELNFIDE